MTTLKALKKKGLRDTLSRRLVLSALQTTHDPCSPYDLRRVIRKQGSSVSIATIYRTVRILEECGLIHHHGHNGHLSLCSRPTDKGIHACLHCTKCNEHEEFVSNTMSALDTEIQRQSQFTPRVHRIEVEGLCSSCSSHAQ